jgi:hypothetical protein
VFADVIVLKINEGDGEMTEDRRGTLFADLTDEQKNALIGSAIDSWMEKKWAAFGKWTARGVAAAAFGYLVLFLATHGSNPFK